MATYTQIEAAIRDELIGLAVLDLNENTCSNDIDTLVPSMLTENSRFGCLLSFGGGGKQTREAFAGTAPSGFSMGSGRQWVWRIFGTLFIRYIGDPAEMETVLRTAIDTLKNFLAEPAKRRLNGLVPFADIAGIEVAESFDINEIPFYLVTFSIDVWDKS